MDAQTTSAPATLLSPTKRALLALKTLQDKLDALEQAKHEPIAIIGMSCRLPGGANTPEALWKLLLRQKDAIAPVPKDRWPLEAFYHPDPSAPGKVVAQSGGFIPHLYDFDAPFFRISPREALTLDPQQRLALELGWEALENAAIAPETISAESGQSVGVFLGISSIDHWQKVLAQPPEALDAYLATGNTHSVAAGRLSYLLGVTGPSMAVDTACSSALVAVHLACQSLRNQECTIALAGGVNRIITPAASISFSKARMLSADGRCRTFDQAASGFGRAEGGGMVALKRLSDAREAGDRIHAVILGSAVNHNGRTNGLTAPSRTAQQAVIRQAIAASRIEADDVSYIETHGTGTALGDPIEVGALSDVFGDLFGKERGQNPPENPIILGAVKTNIGHTEAAAGIAGLIKAALATQHRQIPANLHLKTPNPEIEWHQLPFHLPEQTLDWQPAHQQPTAGISAFGFNGSNAHLILQAAPEPSVSAEATETPQLLPLSAQTPAALKQLAARYAQHLSAHPNVNLADLCYTASIGRSHFTHRLAILTSTPTDLRQILIDIIAGRPHPHCLQSADLGQLADISGEDAQWQTALRYVQGEPINWQAYYQQNASTAGQVSPHRIVDLPLYPFQRQYYGPDSAQP
ncbi:MAG: beta-ketoacyl synthase N-terminal-like domain-containing protein [Cyanobacteria bacterium J06607_13]